MRNQLLPIDGIADAGKPFEELCSDMLRLVMPTAARGPFPDEVWPGRSALEHVLGGTLDGGRPRLRPRRRAVRTTSSTSG